ncbi:MAG: hypothetical protein WC284_09225 [Candidimonas sp.]
MNVNDIDESGYWFGLGREFPCHAMAAGEVVDYDAVIVKVGFDRWQIWVEGRLFRSDRDESLFWPFYCLCRHVGVLDKVKPHGLHIDFRPYSVITVVISVRDGMMSLRSSRPMLVTESSVGLSRTVKTTTTRMLINCHDGVIDV